MGGIDYSNYILLESLNVDNNVVMTSDSATLIMQLDGELPRPFAGQEFIWKTVDSTTGAEINREFGGVVVQVEETTDGPSLVYHITVKSYVHWLDRHLVVNWYSQYYVAGTKAQLLALKPGDAANINDTITNGNGDGIINRIVAQFCPGFTCNNVVPTAVQVIPQYFNYTRPSAAIKVIADQLQYGYYIDYYRDVHLYAFESFTSPLPSNVLDVDNDLSSYGDLTLAEDGQQVYNKVFLRGFKTRCSVPISLTYLADSSSKQWSLGYRASSVKGDMHVAVFSSMAAYMSDTSFHATGVASVGRNMIIARDIVDGSPEQLAAADTAYIQYTQYLVRVPNYDGAGVLPTGYVVGVFFYYLKDVVYMGQDMQSQSILAKTEGTDGIYEYSVEDKSLTNSTIGAPQAKAQLLIQKYGKPQITGSFESFIPGWRAGQSFTLLTKRRMGGINEKMYVLRVTKTLVNNVNGNYKVQNLIEFANSPYLV